MAVDQVDISHNAVKGHAAGYSNLQAPLIAAGAFAVP